MYNFNRLEIWRNEIWRRKNSGFTERKQEYQRTGCQPTEMDCCFALVIFFEAVVSNTRCFPALVGSIHKWLCCFFKVFCCFNYQPGKCILVHWTKPLSFTKISIEIRAYLQTCTNMFAVKQIQQMCSLLGDFSPIIEASKLVISAATYLHRPSRMYWCWDSLAAQRKSLDLSKVWLDLKRLWWSFSMMLLVGIIFIFLSVYLLKMRRYVTDVWNLHDQTMIFQPFFASKYSPTTFHGLRGAANMLDS